VIVNPAAPRALCPGQHEERRIKVYNDNVTIFDEIAKGNADLMMTRSETRFQQKLHAGVLCAVIRTAVRFLGESLLAQRDAALKAFVDQWLHSPLRTRFKRIFAAGSMIRGQSSEIDRHRALIRLAPGI